MGCHSSKEARGVDEPRVNPKRGPAGAVDVQGSDPKLKTVSRGVVSKKVVQRTADDDNVEEVVQEEIHYDIVTQERVRNQNSTSNKPDAEEESDIDDDASENDDVPWEEEEPDNAYKAATTVYDTQDQPGADKHLKHSGVDAYTYGRTKYSDACTSPVTYSTQFLSHSSLEDEREHKSKIDAMDISTPSRRFNSNKSMATAELETPVREYVSRKTSQVEDAMEAYSPTSYVRAVVGVNSPLYTSMSENGNSKDASSTIPSIEEGKESSFSASEVEIQRQPDSLDYRIHGSNLTRRPTPHPSKFADKGYKTSSDIYVKSKISPLYENERDINQITEEKGHGPELPVTTLVDRYFRKQSSAIEENDPLPKFESGLEPPPSSNTPNHISTVSTDNIYRSQHQTPLSLRSDQPEYYFTRPSSLSSPLAHGASPQSTSSFTGTSAKFSSSLPPNKPQTETKSGGVYQPSCRRVAQMFDLNQNEVLEDYKSFHCALDPDNGDRLAQGRLFILDSYVCFYSDVFGSVHKRVHFLDEIAEVCRANTAAVVPNAIKIVRKDGRSETFTSFADREEAFSALLAAITRPSSSTNNGVRPANPEASSASRLSSYSS